MDPRLSDYISSSSIHADKNDAPGRSTVALGVAQVACPAHPGNQSFVAGLRGISTDLNGGRILNDMVEGLDEKTISSIRASSHIGMWEGNISMYEALRDRLSESEMDA
ncbi:MAG: hypothetical protein TREMPRED_001581 [Tremellales sp. Tagirdzhanova-0007]|nr:MAG: hypothetical protein TREMPRED_001581 [Tremellales sp. Tagirdzhanova-0007]